MINFDVYNTSTITWIFDVSEGTIGKSDLSSDNLSDFVILPVKLKF